MPSSAHATSMWAYLLTRSSSRLLWSGSSCCTSTNAMPSGSPVGMAARNSSMAARPPAEAPMPTTGKFGGAAALRVAVGLRLLVVIQAPTRRDRVTTYRTTILSPPVSSEERRCLDPQHPGPGGHDMDDTADHADVFGVVHRHDRRFAKPDFVHGRLQRTHFSLSGSGLCEIRTDLHETRRLAGLRVADDEVDFVACTGGIVGDDPAAGSAQSPPELQIHSVFEPSTQVRDACRRDREGESRIDRVHLLGVRFADPERPVEDGDGEEQERVREVVEKVIERVFADRDAS